MGTRQRVGSILFFLSTLTTYAAQQPLGPYLQPQPLEVASHERLVTILATNDIHGGVEPSLEKNGKTGGMAFFSGVVSSVRKGLQDQFGDRANVLVVDGGDQFQGTLLSNYNEGELVFKTMNAVGYDAVVPGNHDYDFGPEGWLDDQVTPQTKDQNPRGVIEKLAKLAKFPLLSANTYLVDSLVNKAGNKVSVESIGCRVVSSTTANPTPPPAAEPTTQISINPPVIPSTPPATEPSPTPTSTPAPTPAPTPGPDIDKTTEIDWTSAKHPAFLRSYLIKNFNGVRVAIVGLDSETTPEMTTVANVSDLCFRDARETYLEIRKELEGQADIFVIVIHSGSTRNLIKSITKVGPNQLHAVVAAHTHTINDEFVGDVPVIQSLSGGIAFGRIDLVWDTEKKTVVTARTRKGGGIRLPHQACHQKALNFCAVDLQTANPAVSYEGTPVTIDAQVDKLIAQSRADVAPLADRKIGEADGLIYRNRISESPMSNLLTDGLRAVSGADIAMINTGGIRDSFDAGSVTYEDLFRVIPFGNHGYVVGPMAMDRIIELLERSIATCGGYGALMQSGLRVQYTRDCSGGGSVASSYSLLKVKTIGGEVLYEQVEEQTAMGVIKKGVTYQPDRVFNVATLDFLVAGGSGYSGFYGMPLISDLGILREVLTEQFLKNPGTFSSKVDGRWKEVQPGAILE